MTLYDLHTYQPSGLRQEDQNQVFNTCMAKTTALLGWTDNQTLLASFYPVLSAACVNVTKVAALLYDRGQPLDIDRISPPGLAVPLYGVISPILIVLSLVLNGGLVAMLVRQRMRTATAVFLGGMAVLDSLTGGLQLPFLVYGYVLDGHESYPNMAWCRVYWYVSKLLPTVTHTASLWLAAMLALQRHLGVSRSRTTKHACVKCTAKFTNVLCSVKGAMVVVFICSITAGILHALQAAFFTLKPVKVLSKEVLTSHGLDVIDTCSLRLKDQSLEVAHNYVYTWLRLLLGEFLPCFLIGRFNYNLVRLTRSSARYRRSLVHGHRESEKQWNA
ncbi:sex peptide receptor-like [Littorina saxatilis]|uniref:sex peptide receptor-like n=1 Tax=Littorina saxatilis TaxID=31220 RepID=UPI0038B5987D